MIGKNLFCFTLLVSLAQAQEVSLPELRDTLVSWHGEKREAIYLGTDLAPKTLVAHWEQFARERFQARTRALGKEGAGLFYVSRATGKKPHAMLAGDLHTGCIPLGRESTLWLFFATGQADRGAEIAKLFLLDRMAGMYNEEFEVMKRQVHFLEKELDLYRNRLLTNRRLIAKLEKENETLEVLIREEEDALREMLRGLADKVRKWERMRAIP